MSLANRFCWYVSVIWTWSRGKSCSFSTELAADADSGAEMPPKSKRVSTVGRAAARRRAVDIALGEPIDVLLIVQRH